LVSRGNLNRLTSIPKVATKVHTKICAQYIWFGGKVAVSIAVARKAEFETTINQAGRTCPKRNPVAPAAEIPDIIMGVRYAAPRIGETPREIRNICHM
jgi:hypothetical protein